MSTRFPIRVLLLAVLTALSLLPAACSAPGTAINTGETYLDGSWYYDDGDLRVGYNFFPNGTGYLFVGNTPTPIRYGIYMGNLYVDANGDVNALPFGEEGENLLIGGLTFRPVVSPDDSGAALLSTPESVDPSLPSDTGGTAFRTAALILAALVVLALIAAILFRFFRNRKQPSNRP
ncbi:MAG: hypothetical protein ILO68_02995 [Clostridia bacterium]|nr:hypothetical protein [Clostridia bacterium]